jgi:hypothetical protein
MEDGASKSALAMMIFGRAGATMIPLLNAGSAGMREAREEARLLGVAIDSEAGRAAEVFNDNLSRLGSVLDGFGNKLAAEFVGPLNDATDQLVAAAKYSKEFKDTLDSAVKFIKTSVLTVFQTFGVVGSDIAFVFRMLGGEIGAIAAQFAAIARLDFKGARLIGEEWMRDAAQARADLDDFQKRLMALGEKPTTAENLLGDELGTGAPAAAKRKGPVIQSSTDVNKALNAEKAAQAESIKGWIAHAEAVFAAAEAELLELAKINEIKFEAAEKGLESTMAFLATEEQLQEEAHAKRLEQLLAARQAELVTQEEFDNLAETLEYRHQEKLSEIAYKGLSEREKFSRMSMLQQAKTIFGELSNITAGVSQHNKKLFNLNKVAGIANAVVNAYIGISKTLAAYPFPFNVALAAAHAAAAFAQVSAIRSATFGGGGGAAPSLAGGTAATPVTPVQGGDPSTARGGGQSTTFVLPDSSFVSTQAVREMLVAYSEEVQANGGRMTVR